MKKLLLGITVLLIILAIIHFEKNMNETEKPTFKLIKPQNGMR